MDPGGVQSLPCTALTVQCDRSQFSMAQLGTGAERNSRDGGVHPENVQFSASAPTELIVRNRAAAPSG